MRPICTSKVIYADITRCVYIYIQNDLCIYQKRPVYSLNRAEAKASASPVKTYICRSLLTYI